MPRQNSLADPVSQLQSFGRSTSEPEGVIPDGRPAQENLETRRVNSEAAIFHMPLLGRPSDVRRVRGRTAVEEPSREAAAFPGFRRICDDIFNELSRIDGCLVNETSGAGSSGVVAEIEILLERLYDYPYGKSESLKRLVVAVQSQVNNADWDNRHVEFLRDVVHYLRVRYLVDETSVAACFNMMKARGLDPFRGTVSETRTVKKYRIEEVSSNDAAARQPNT